MKHEPVAQPYEINEPAQGSAAQAGNFGNGIALFGGLLQVSQQAGQDIVQSFCFSCQRESLALCATNSRAYSWGGVVCAKHLNAEVQSYWGSNEAVKNNCSKVLTSTAMPPINRKCCSTANTKHLRQSCSALIAYAE